MNDGDSAARFGGSKPTILPPWLDSGLQDIRTNFGSPPNKQKQASWREAAQFQFRGQAGGAARPGLVFPAAALASRRAVC
jgi:hypothetical protein